MAAYPRGPEPGSQAGVALHDRKRGRVPAAFTTCGRNHAVTSAQDWTEAAGMDHGRHVLHARTRMKGRTWQIVPTLIAFLAAQCALHVPAAADVPETPCAEAGEKTVGNARRLIRAGHAGDALAPLRRRTAGCPDDLDAGFLLGMAALAAVRLPRSPGGAAWTSQARRRLYDEAAGAFRRILEHRPDLPRPRLELARALFERGRCTEPPDDLVEHLFGDDCDAARHHFRRVLSGELPEPVIGNVNRYLVAIRARKRLSGHFQAALAPDSNVNAATHARTVRIFGLPFELDEDARASSGIGLSLSAAGEFQHPLSTNRDMQARLRLGAGLYRREYGGSRFDDMTVTAHAGPRLLFRRSDLSFLAKARRRWYANEPYNDGLGLRIEGGRRLGNRMWLGASVEVTKLNHHEAERLDGPHFDAGVSASFALAPAMRLGLRTGWRRARTSAPIERHATKWISPSIDADLPRILGAVGFSLGFSQDFHFTDYERANPNLNPDPRRDRLLISRVEVRNERIGLGGFTPVLALIHERRESNLAIHRYRRNRAEITLRRRF